MSQLAFINDTSGRHIANVHLQFDDEGIVSLIPSQRSRRALLQHYFNDGGREVRLEVGDVTIRGGLRTRMDGTTRVWWIVVQPSARIAEARTAVSA
jgi:hypothetical protein